MRSGWLQLRPNIAERKFVRVLQEPWAKDLRCGTHRLRQQWCDKRFDHLDQDGMPQKPKALKVNEDAGQAHIELTEQARVLDSWEEMSKTGELTEEHLKDLSQDPACEFCVTEFQKKLTDFKDLADLLKTPKMKRQAAGIDVHLMTQVKSSADKVAARKDM